MEISSARADAWVWAVRFTKTRSQARAACRAGHVRINGERAKASAPVRVGDHVEARVGDRLLMVEVRQLLVKRVGVPVAQAAYVDHSPPPPPREYVAPPAVRDPGSGRPTKRERRQTDRLLGRRPR